MADAIAISAAGGVPPLPPGGTQGAGVASHGNVPAAPTFPTNPLPTPGAPAAPAAGGFTEEQVQARIAAALAERQPAQTPAAAPEPFDFGADTREDPLLDSMTGLFNSAAAAGGVDIERAIGKAVQHGNALLIDEAYIREKGGANAAHLIQIAKSLVGHINTVTTQATTAAHSAAGGEQQWNVASATFNATAPDHLKLIVKKMLDSGSVQQITAAAKMVVEQAQSSGKLPKAPGLVSPTQGGGAAGAALGKMDFQLAHAKLDRNSPTFARDRADLMNRRALGKQLGL